MTSFGYCLNLRYAIKECSSCGTLYTRDCCCSKGDVADKILDPKPPKNYARCGHPVDGPYCQRCALLRKKLEEDLVTHFQDFHNTSESSDDSTNVVNAPREPFVVKQDHENVLGDGEVCQRCTCTRCGSGLSKELCYICGNNQNSLNDSPSISVNSSQNPPYIDKCCYECGDALDGIFCQRCTCKSCEKGAHIGYNCPPKVPIISNPEPCNQTMNNEPPQTLPSFDPTCYSEKENSLPCVSKPDFVDESPDVFNPPPQPPIYSCEFCESNALNGHYCTPQVPFIYLEPVVACNYYFCGCNLLLIDKWRGQSMSVKDTGVISSALSSLQNFSNDVTFLHQFKGPHQQKNDDSSSTDGDDRRDSKSEEPLSRTNGGRLHFAVQCITFLCENLVLALKVQFRRTSLTGFPAQSIRSSNAIALDSPYLLVLVTGTSQSRQHESRKSPTAELFDVDSGRISIHHCEY
nr:hypothetical protein [Tanacetum cinerariifolium]